jgi:hypothetical protein
MKSRVSPHQELHPIEIVAIDCLLQFDDIFTEVYLVDVRFQPSPARKAVHTRNIQLRLSQRHSLTGLQQGFCLVFEMAKIGVLG